jgi:hypothetical protein
MIHPVKSVFIAIGFLLVLHAGTGLAESPALLYPDSLLNKLGLDSNDIVKNQETFRKDRVHLEWMAHVHEVMPDMDAAMKDRIINIHTSMLFIKDRINSAYLSGSIDQEEFTAQSAELMQWFLKSHQAVLDEKQYNSLFGISTEDKSPREASEGDELGFPIRNPVTTVEMVKEKIDERTLSKIADFYQDHSRELRDVKKIYETGDFRGVTEEQVRNDMKRVEKELHDSFMDYCRGILTEDQFKMIFGNAGEKK